MKTLNKTLSLILALAMVFGLMGVASASFTDQSKITHTTAVNTCVALNIINGRTDGSYDPTGTVTRAELCKMICVAYNGGKTPVLATNSTPSYTDIKGTWGEAYIEYCTKLGIVSGNGDGTFSPDATVTGTQAAKMMLVALGFSSANEGFTGTSWDVAVNVRANQKGLYDGLVSTFDPSSGLSRDDAAQMIYNMLEAYEVSYTYQITTNANGSIVTTAVLKDSTDSNGNKTTFEEDKYSLNTSIGVFSKETYNSTTKLYSISTTADTTLNSKSTAGSFVSSTDYSQYFGMLVKVLYATDSDGDDVVYGVVPLDSTIISSGMLGTVYTDMTDDTTATSFTSNSTTYKFDTTIAATPIYYFNDYKNNMVGHLSALAAYNYEFIDQDGDGDIDIIVSYPYTVQKITSLTSTTVTAKTIGLSATYQSLAGSTGTILSATSLDDVDGYTGMAKSDYVKVTDPTYTVDGKYKVEKLTAMSGTVTKLKGTFSAGTQKVYVSEASTWLMNATGSKAELASYTDVYQVNGFIFYAKEGSSITTTTQYALLTWADTYAGEYEAKLFFTDGTSKVVTAAADYSETDPNWSTNIVYSTSASVNNVRDFTAGPQLVTYKVSSSTGAYTLTPASKTSGVTQDPFDINVGESIGVGADVDATDSYLYSSSGSTIGGYKIADDAVIFAHAADNSATKVITGAVLKTLASSAVVRVNNAYANTSDSTGYSTIVLASVELGSTISGTKTYGYVTEVDSASVNDGDGYDVTVWNGSSSLSLSTTDEGIAAGDVISYSANTDGTYAITVEPVKKGAITALSGTDLQISNTDGTKKASSVSTSINSTTTTVIGADTKKEVGSTDNDLAIAQTDDDGNYIYNVLYIDGSDEDHAFDLIIIDNVNDSVSTVTTSSIDVTSTKADTESELSALFSEYDVVNITNAYTPSTSIVVPLGCTLTTEAGATVASTTSWTINGTAVIDAVTVTGTAIKVASTGKLTVTGSLAEANLNKIQGTAAGATLVLGEASGTLSADSTLFYSAVGTAYASGATVPAGTYVWVASASAASGGTSGWVLQ